MEESSNGKLEEIRREESGDKEKEVVADDSGELKTEDESVTVMVVDGNSESLNENNDGGGDSSSSSSSDEEAEADDKSPQVVVDSGEFEEEKAVAVSVVDSADHEVPQFEEFNDGGEDSKAKIVEAPDVVTEFYSIETEEEVSNETSGASEEVSNEASKVKEEATLPCSDGNDGVSSVVTEEVVSKVIEEIKLPSSEENGEAVPVPAAITEEESKTIEASKQGTGESSYAVDMESKEKVEESLPALANSGNVENITNVHETANQPEIYESNVTPPITSLTQRTVTPTSWRSCCGLFEVLRRSDR